MPRIGVGLSFALTAYSLCLPAAVAQSTARTEGWAERGARPRYFASLYPVAGPAGGPLIVRRGVVRTWDGSTWARLASIAAGGTGAIVDMAWDHQRNRTVGLGLDLTVFPYQFRTFELVDGAFQILAAVPGSVPLELHYDPALGGVVAFCDTATGTQDYLWSGTVWNPLPANVRPAHVRSTLVADGQRARLVAFTPDSPGPGGQTWEWDGTTWTQQQPLASPTARDSTAMVFDPASGLTMLHGGHVGSTTLRDTWLWDGSNWVQSTAPAPATTAAVELVLDRTDGVLLLDRAAMSTRDYRWSNGTWVPGPESLRMVDQTLLGNDRARGVLTMLQGDRTYDWDGFAWRHLATGGPGPRLGTTLAFDPSSNDMLLFGGHVGPQSQQDTWLWNGSQWRQRTPANRPSRRHGHAMFTSSALNGVVLFGGTSGPLTFSDTWLWQNGTWTERFFAVHPPGGRSVGNGGRPGQTPIVASGGELWSFGGIWQLLDANMPYPAVSTIGLTRGGNPVVTANANHCYEFRNGLWYSHTPPDTEVSDLGYDPVRGDILGVGFGHEAVFSTELATSAPVGQPCTNDRFALFAAGDPFLGNGEFRVHADGGAGFAVFAFSLASTPSQLGGGCISYLANPIAAGFVTSNAYDVATLPTPIPLSASLRSVRLWLQSAGPQPGGPFGGLAVSAGLELVIGG
ncbi:MAG: hypothetical protein NXI31_26270 [bacterium]|nr:hypothetical protein [bacterium]